MEGRLLYLTILKQAFLSLICAATLLWLSWWLVASEPMKDPKYLDRLPEARASRFFRVDGKYGLAIIYQAFPLMVVALLSFGVVEIRKRIEALQNQPHAASTMSKEGLDKMHMEAKVVERPVRRPSISTYPLVVAPSRWWWNPFGSVLTAAEVLFVVGMLILVFYSYGRLTHLDFEELEEGFHDDPKSFRTELWESKLFRASENLGRAALIPFALLWIPVSRGSPFLRLIGMPFEHAVKYHIWLAMLTLTLLTGHAVGFFIYYSHTDSLYKVFDWVTERERCSLVAGFIAWISGLVMWATSLSIFRRRWYEFFFGVHHLYILFFVFWLYHAIYTIHFFIVPCILFVVDRFLRMLQSRQSVDVLSAKVLESGAIQLRLATNTRSTQAYHALSSWYLRVPSLSRLMKLQWHFFSVTSTPLDEKPELSMVIQPLGKWTTSLQKQLVQSMETTTRQATMDARCPFSFKAGIEGPYGDETDFFLRYQTLVLVGGGIGITPLLAILCDVLHRQQRRIDGKSLPTSIEVFHCVRTAGELCVLNSVDPNEISPGYETRGLHIRVSAFVTSSSSLLGYVMKEANMAELMQETRAPALIQQTAIDLSTFGGTTRHGALPAPCREIRSPCVTKSGPHHPISSIGTKGHPLWVASIAMASLLGFYLLFGLSNVYIVKHLRDDFPTNFTRVHLVLACLLLSTVVLGGSLGLVWWLINTRKAERAALQIDSGKVGIASHVEHELQNVRHEDAENAASTDRGGSPWNGTVQLNARPIWNDIFTTLEKQYPGQNIGVLVSGSESMQEDIARECQRHTRLFGASPSSNVFHYHSVSFEL